jgi:hypothetical protein
MNIYCIILYYKLVITQSEYSQDIRLIRDNTILHCYYRCSSKATLYIKGLIFLLIELVVETIMVNGYYCLLHILNIGPRRM